jgi:hypothetical protein
MPLHSLHVSCVRAYARARARVCVILPSIHQRRTLSALSARRAIVLCSRPHTRWHYRPSLHASPSAQASDHECVGHPSERSTEKPTSFPRESAAWRMACLRSTDVLPFRANLTGDPFYTLTAVNSAECLTLRMRQEMSELRGGVTVLTFVDRPGHYGHSNFVHSMRALGYGPHVNIDVDRKSRCRARLSVRMPTRKRSWSVCGATA